MTVKVANGSSIHHVGDSSAQIAAKTCTEHTLKAENIFKKEIIDPAQAPRDDEREAFIEYYMKEKNVTRAVAAAEYDFFI